MRPDGIETVTESMNPGATRLLQTSVTALLGTLTVLVGLRLLLDQPPIADTKNWQAFQRTERAHA